MPLRQKRGPGGESGRQQFNIQNYLTFTLFLILLLSATLTSAAPADNSVGYGPLFDSCGDNCQTSLLQFCTQNHNAKQQSDCWCGRSGFDSTYNDRMNACLATCDPSVSDINTQRGQLMAYRNVVCQGNPAAGGSQFAQFYATRYQGVFTPDATAAAPPPTILVSSLLESISTATSSSRSASTSVPVVSSPSTITQITSFSITTSRRSSSSTTSTSSFKTTSTPISSTLASSSSTTSTTTTPTQNATAAPDTRGSKKSLTMGAIAGISVGSVLAFSVPFLAIALLIRRRRQRNALLPGKKQISPTPDSYFSRNTPSAQGYILTPVDEPSAAKEFGRQPTRNPNPGTEVQESSDPWTRRLSRRVTELLGFTPETGSLDLDFELGAEGRLDQFPLPPVPQRVAERPAIHPLYPYPPRKTPLPEKLRNGSGNTTAAVYGSASTGLNSTSTGERTVQASMGSPEEFILPPTPRRLPDEFIDDPAMRRFGGGGGVRLVTPPKAGEVVAERRSLDSDIESVTSDGSYCSWSQYGGRDSEGVDRSTGTLTGTGGGGTAAGEWVDVPLAPLNVGQQQQQNQQQQNQQQQGRGGGGNTNTGYWRRAL